MHGRDLLIFNKITDLHTRIVAVHNRHVDVQKDQGVLTVAVFAVLPLENFLKGLRTVDRTVDFELVGFEHQCQGVDVEFIIVDNQYLSTALLLLESVWEKTISLDPCGLSVSENVVRLK